MPFLTTPSRNSFRTHRLEGKDRTVSLKLKYELRDPPIPLSLQEEMGLLSTEFRRQLAVTTPTPTVLAARALSTRIPTTISTRSVRQTQRRQYVSGPAGTIVWLRTPRAKMSSLLIKTTTSVLPLECSFAPDPSTPIHKFWRQPYLCP